MMTPIYYIPCGNIVIIRFTHESDRNLKIIIIFKKRTENLQVILIKPWHGKGRYI